MNHDLQSDGQEAWMPGPVLGCGRSPAGEPVLWTAVTNAVSPSCGGFPQYSRTNEERKWRIADNFPVIYPHTHTRMDFDNFKDFSNKCVHKTDYKPLCSFQSFIATLQKSTNKITA